jgi:SanA protein
MFKKILPSILIIISIGFSILLICDYWVISQTRSRLYESIEALPTKEIGLVLGTRKTLQDGQINVYFSARIETAAKLIKHNKIKKLLLSGARIDDNYDELRDMYQDLLKQGISPDQMIIDNYGFHTIDSIINAKKVFKINDFVIISQGFHNERALFMADFYDLKAIGFNAADPMWSWRIKMTIREYFARVRLFLDLYFLKTI